MTKEGGDLPCGPVVGPSRRWLQTDILFWIPTCQGNRLLFPAASFFPCQQLAFSITRAAHRNTPFFHWYLQEHFLLEEAGERSHKRLCWGWWRQCPGASSSAHLCWKRSVPSWRGLPFSVAQFPHLQEMNLATCIPLRMPAWFIQTAWTPAESQVSKAVISLWGQTQDTLKTTDT